MKTMKTMKTTIFKRIFAAVFAAVLALNLFPVFAAENTVSTSAELKAFLNGCQSDEFSRGKSFVILNDIDFGGEELPQGTVFCGTLEANGHRIYNFKMNTASNAGGFFSEIGEDGYVSGLNLQGEITGGFKETNDNMSKDKIMDDIRRNLGASGVGTGKATRPVGGIAGINKGRIYACGFEGTIDGEKNVGGICGKNADSGIIESCVVKGEVCGVENTGGICGENTGIIRSCTNGGKVNPEADASALNTGGIAGDNGGVLEGCVNTGAVGCEGYGTNTGGISGKQSGCILGCANEGSVSGKKNTGGVTGIFTPYTDIDADLDGVRDELEKERQDIENEYDKLKSDVKSDIEDVKDGLNIFSSADRDSLTEGRRNVLDSVSSYIDNAAENADSSSQSRSNLIDSLSGYLDDAKSLNDNIKTITDSLDENISTLTQTLTALRESSDENSRAMRTLMDTVSDSLTSSSNDSSRLKQSLADAADRIDIDTEGLDKMADSLDTTLNSVDRAVRSLDKNGDDISQSITAPLNLLYKQLRNKQKDIENRKKKLEELKKSLEELGTAVDDWLKQKGDRWEIVPDDTPSDEWEEIPGTVVEEDKTEDKTASLFNAITGFIFPRVRAAEYKGLDEIFDTEAIKEEMKKIISVDVALDRNVAGEYFDNAVIRNSSNTGEVKGYSESGGIAGTMGVEKLYTDGETITLPGGKPVISDITMKAVIDSCVNDGKINARTENSGGIVGSANMGIVKNCLGAGDISSDKNIGSIGGNCLATVLYSIGAARLGANEYVGGIAGKGGNIHECYSIALIEGDEPKQSGSIAGSAEGSVKNNYYLDEGIGGIGGISYEDNAQGIKFENMISSDTLPEAMKQFFNSDWFVAAGDKFFPQIPSLANAQGFNSEILQAKSAEYAKTHFNVSFIIDGECVKSLVKEYGEKLGKNEVPKIPKKKGTYPYWDRSVSKPILRHSVFTAVFGDAVSTISSGENPPIVLLEGLFSENTKVSVKEIETDKSFGGYRSAKAYRLKVTPASDGEDGFTIRILDKKGKGEAIGLLDENKIVETTRDGSYIVCKMDKPHDFVILERDSASAVLIWIAAAVLVLAAAVVGIVAIRKKRRK